MHTCSWNYNCQWRSFSTFSSSLAWFNTHPVRRNTTLITPSPDVSGSDWSIASFLVPCQLTRFSLPEELCSPGFLSCSCFGTCALYQYLLSSIRSRISVASGWTKSPQVSQRGWITKSINTTWEGRERKNQVQSPGNDCPKDVKRILFCLFESTG